MALSENVKIALKVEVANSTNDVKTLSKTLDQLNNSLQNAKAGTQEYNAAQQAVTTVGAKLNKSLVNNAIAASNEAKSISELNKSMKLLKAAQEGVDKSSPDFKKLSDAINKTEGRVGDLGDSFKTLTGTGVEKLKSSFGLLGESLMSADFDKAKIGLQGIGGAMKAIPIFLLISGLEYLVAHFDDLKKMFFKVTDEAKTNKDAMEALKIQTEKNREATDKYVAALEKQLNNLALTNAPLKTQIDLIRKIRKLKVDQIDEEIKQKQTAIENTKALIEADKKRLEQTQLSAAGTNASIQTTVDAQKMQLESTLQNLEQELINLEAVKIEKDAIIIESAEKEKKVIKDSQQQEKEDLEFLRQLNKESEAIYQERINKEIEAEKRAKDEKERLEDEAFQRKFQRELELENKNKADKKSFLRSEMDDTDNSYQERLTLIDSYYQREIELAREKGETTYVLEKEYADKKEKLQDEQDKKTKEKAKQTQQDLMQIYKAAFDLAVAISDAKFAREISNADREYNEKLSYVEEGSAEAQKLEEEHAKQVDDLSRQQFENNKKFQLSNVIINGAAGVIAALAVQNYVGAAATAAAAVAQGIKINSTQYQSSAISIPKPTKPSRRESASISDGASSGSGNSNSTDLSPQLRKIGADMPMAGYSSGGSGSKSSDEKVVRAYVVQTDLDKSNNKAQVLKRKTNF